MESQARRIIKWGENDAALSPKLKLKGTKEGFEGHSRTEGASEEKIMIIPYVLAHLRVEVAPVVDDVHIRVHLPRLDRSSVPLPRHLETLEAGGVVLHRVKVFGAHSGRHHVHYVVIPKKDYR